MQGQHPGYMPSANLANLSSDLMTKFGLSLFLNKTRSSLRCFLFCLYLSGRLPLTPYILHLLLNNNTLIISLRYRFFKPFAILRIEVIKFLANRTSPCLFSNTNGFQQLIESLFSLANTVYSPDPSDVHNQ